MNNRMLCPVMLLVGVGVGVGVGILISKPKIDEQKKEIKQLVTQSQAATAETAQSEELLQKAKAELSRSRSELKRMKSLNTQTVMQLADARKKLDAMKSRVPESPTTLPDIGEPEVVITTPGVTGRTATTTDATDYTVEDGDSFWKIAQEQLGDGNRYIEILELNPDYSENQTLVIGTKIKIPTR